MLNLLRRSKKETLVSVTITAEQIYSWYNTLTWHEDISIGERWHEDNNPCPIEEALSYELPKAKTIDISLSCITIKDKQGEEIRFPTTYDLLSWISALNEGADLNGIRLILGFNKEGYPEAHIAAYLEDV